MTEVERRRCPGTSQVVDCKWGSWLDWSDCTKTCGGGSINDPNFQGRGDGPLWARVVFFFGGSMRRSRAVEAAPRNGGLPCQAEDKEAPACFLG